MQLFVKNQQQLNTRYVTTSLW